MPTAGERKLAARLLRLVGVAIASVPCLLLAWMGLERLRRHTPEWVYWQAAVTLLVGIDLAYKLLAVIAIVGTTVLGAAIVMRRRSVSEQRALARGLAFSLALLFAGGVSESVCAVWGWWSHRFSAVPEGGLASSAPAESLARFAPPPATMELRTDYPDPPGDSQIDVVVMGESSAEGVPFNRWLSVGKIVAWKMQEALSDRKVELNVIARSGDTLEKQHLILSNVSRRPDLLIIYCGHNEFYSRLWWARNLEYYDVDRRSSSLLSIGGSLAGHSAVCRLIRETTDRCRIAIPPPENTGRSLVDVPNYTADEFALLLNDFRRRLDELVSYAERVGALSVLILPPGNDTHFEPNRSYLPARTPIADREAFGRELLAAIKLEASDPGEARARYRVLIERQPCFAETHYRLARSLEHAGEWEEAYREYAAARDLDGMPVRCLSPFQQAYRDVAARHRCILVDGQSYFHAIGRHGLLDDELFQDAMHPSLRGQIALAQRVLIALRDRGAFGWPSDSKPPLVDPAECVSHFGIDQNTWIHGALWWKGFNELLGPLRYDQAERLRRRAVGITAMAKIKGGAAPESVGLPNVGVPAAVPVVTTLPDSNAPGSVTPCLGN
jgi:tetratricopeptide (TPR) repeat protein